MRMRKKEENPVNRKTVQKRNTNPCTSGGSTLCANSNIEANTAC